jgi:DNA invertase Pin-like site-specific DNA recombinase
MLIGYARVSTADQNTEAQLPALRAAKCKKLYHEEGSGRNMERLELEKCLDRLEQGDTLVVWRLDRLARSIRDLLEIMDRLDKTGVHFRSLTENFDTTTAAGRLVFHFFAALTQFGRKPKINPQQARQIKILWADKGTTKKELAEQYKVSIATIDRIVRPKSLKA